MILEILGVEWPARLRRVMRGASLAAAVLVATVACAEIDPPAVEGTVNARLTAIEAAEAVETPPSPAVRLAPTSTQTLAMPVREILVIAEDRTYPGRLPVIIEDRGEAVTFVSFEEVRTTDLALVDYTLVYVIVGCLSCYGGSGSADEGREFLVYISTELQDYVYSGGVAALYFPGDDNFAGVTPRAFTDLWSPYSISAFQACSKPNFRPWSPLSCEEESERTSRIYRGAHPIFQQLEGEILWPGSHYPVVGVFGSLGPEWSALAGPESTSAAVSGAAPLAHIVEAEYGEGLFFASQAQMPVLAGRNATAAFLEEGVLTYLLDVAGR